jgi:hypothetical protein
MAEASGSSREMSEGVSTERKEASTAQTELDTLLAHIELTLISIIQAVALTFLVDRSYDVLVGLRITCWPYAFTGLLVILLFWSRSVLHTLTVIRWPLDLIHNFMYIACAMVEAVTFTQLTNTLNWYALNTLFGLMTWVLFALDLRMIRCRIIDSPGPTGSRLYAIVEREQRLNIRLFMPATVAFNLLATMVVRSRPVFFIEEGNHAIIALVQLAAAFGYLLYVMRFSARILPLIVKMRQEWRENVLP